MQVIKGYSSGSTCNACCRSCGPPRRRRRSQSWKNGVFCNRAPWLWDGGPATVKDACSSHGLNFNRFDGRLKLLENIDIQRKQLEQSAATEKYDRERQSAISMLADPKVKRAFDVQSRMIWESSSALFCLSAGLAYRGFSIKSSRPMARIAAVNMPGLSAGIIM